MSEINDTDKTTKEVQVYTSWTPVIYLTILVSVIAISSFFAIAGWNNSTLGKQLEPFKKMFSDIQKTTESKEASPKENNTSYKGTKNMFVITTTPKPTISTPTSTFTPKTNFEIHEGVVRVPTSVPNIIYPTPTAYVYPTIAPGELGSKEWIENFWKKYNENQQKTDSVRESQKKFCEENPSLCNSQ